MKKYLIQRQEHSDKINKFIVINYYIERIIAMFPKSKFTEIYCITDDFEKKICNSKNNSKWQNALHIPIDIQLKIPVK